MFSLSQIDAQVTVFRAVADDLLGMAEETCADPIRRHLRGAMLEGMAEGYRHAADSLERMVANEVEREAREAMR